MPALPISDRLREKLVLLREEQLRRYSHVDKVFLDEDVVILTLGLGPAMYLRFDGRVIVWHYEDDEPPRITDDIREIASGIVIGATDCPMPELLELLPAMPDGAKSCQCCGGERRIHSPSDRDPNWWFVCPRCRGLGWTDPARVS